MSVSSSRLRAFVTGLFILAVAVGWPSAQGQGAAPPQGQTSPDAVPADLRPLLTPRTSEMRLVTLRYTLDRSTLEGNYAGAPGGPGGGRAGRSGRGGDDLPPPPPPTPTVSMSLARIARLASFDRAWESALAKLNTSTLSPVAQAEGKTLRATVASNAARVESERRAVAELTPLLPFARPLVRVIEARLWTEDMDAKEAARAITRATEEISATRARLGAGVTTASPDQALRAAAVVDVISRDLTEWFDFYNGYDPLFTWWVTLPQQHIREALRNYSAFLRETVAPAKQPAVTPATLPTTGIVQNPRTLPAGAEVPDLQALIALPQDELTGIVDLFRNSTAGGRGGAAAPRGAAYFRQWLRALESLDFDKLSRNAQVNYLYIRRLSERRVERDGVALPAPESNPRKKDESGIPGPARGREGLIRDLQDEFIPYTPEELIQLAETEFAWADAEMLKASRAMGFGDNWKAAMDKVKDSHAPPGGQPVVIRNLMHEAVDYLREKELITVPAVAAESFRMSMMSPERQLVNPFFTGGQRITISYPTNTMTFDQRLQSMRGNTTAFSHATAHHEMIPGHNLTGYLNARHNGYRANLGAGTPFFGEGWALYWELVLYDKGFNDTPEERIGALFWRMHRCARIIFSLNFHMGRWSPQEAIDFLVNRVNFERDNATAEVRRSFDPSAGYSALYQAAYLLGGLQLRALRREFVDGGRMPEKQFHDRIVIQGSMPVALHRLAIMPGPLRRDMEVEWRFYR